MAGRPSKLSEQQWLEMSDRALNGEPVRALAREYGVSPSAANERISKMHGNLKDVARQIVATEQALAQLPISAQISAQRLAEDMRAISSNLATAGKMGSIVARKTMEVAAKQSEKVNEDDPMESAEVLQGIAALTKIANDSGQLGLNLIRVSKEQATLGDDDKPKPNRIKLVDGRSNAGTTAEA